MTERGYAAIRRRWQRGDKVTLGLAMPVERIYAHPDVQADQGRVALKRGPIVYCVEAVDTAAPPHLLKLPRESAIVANLEPDLLGGVATLSGTALAIRPADESLYRTEPWPAEGVPFKAVPYPRLGSPRARRDGGLAAGDVITTYDNRNTKGNNQRGKR